MQLSLIYKSWRQKRDRHYAMEILVYKYLQSTHLIQNNGFFEIRQQLMLYRKPLK